MEHSGEGCNGTGSHACCDKNARDTVAVRQTLLEMEFERGIWYAAQTNDVERLHKLLQKGTPVDIQDGAGYTALHHASRGGHFEMCKKLLENGANVNALTRCGNATPLHRSSMRGLSQVTELLLKSGADPNIQDSDGWTPLHRAICANSPSVCRLLIPVSDLSISDKKSRNAFQFAREKNNPDVIRLFRNLVEQ